MNLVRRILEGIHEVELQVTPEFQAPGIGEPEVGRGPLRGAVTWTWRLGREEEDSLEGEFSTHLLQIDASTSTLFGGWNPWHVVRQAFEWVKNHLSDYTSEKVGTHLVKVSPTPTEKEYAERLQREGIIDGFTMVGEDKDEPEVETVFLSSDTKHVIEERGWLEVKHVDQAVTVYNPVMILVKQLPIPGTTEEKENIVSMKMEDLDIKANWASTLDIWKVWPTGPQTMEPWGFSWNLTLLIRRLDDLVGGEG